MALPPAAESIPGSQQLFDWFGYWPDFHDAELKKLRFEIGGESFLVLHTWEMTDKVGSEGFYETTKHVLVEFILRDITELNLNDLWENSILLSLRIGKTETGFRLELSAAYGLSGTIEADNISLRLASQPT